MPWDVQKIKDHLKSAGMAPFLGMNREFELLATYLGENEPLLFGFSCNYQRHNYLAAITSTRLILVSEQGIFKKEVFVENLLHSTITSTQAVKKRIFSEIVIVAANKTYTLEGVTEDTNVILSFINQSKQSNSIPSSFQSHPLPAYPSPHQVVQPSSPYIPNDQYNPVNQNPTYPSPYQVIPPNNPYVPSNQSVPSQQSDSFTASSISQKEQITNVMIEQLERLAKLKEQGILTEEEFSEQKRRILSI